MLGTVAASSRFELVRVTTTPLAGAGAFNVTVPVDEAPVPPATVAGLSVSESTPS
jgi:hypothetical protein